MVIKVCICDGDIAVWAIARTQSAFGVFVFREGSFRRLVESALRAGDLGVELLTMLLDFILVNEHRAVLTFAEVTRAVGFVRVYLANRKLLPAVRTLLLSLFLE